MPAAPRAPPPPAFPNRFCPSWPGGQYGDSPTHPASGSGRARHVRASYTAAASRLQTCPSTLCSVTLGQELRRPSVQRPHAGCPRARAHPGACPSSVDTCPQVTSARSWTSVPWIPVTQAFISSPDPSLYSVFDMLDIWAHNTHLLFHVAEHNCLLLLFHPSLFVAFASINAAAVRPAAQAPNARSWWTPPPLTTPPCPSRPLASPA